MGGSAECDLSGWYERIICGAFDRGSQDEWLGAAGDVDAIHLLKWAGEVWASNSNRIVRVSATAHSETFLPGGRCGPAGIASEVLRDAAVTHEFEYRVIAIDRDRANKALGGKNGRLAWIGWIRSVVTERENRVTANVVHAAESFSVVADQKAMFGGEGQALATEERVRSRIPID